ncbi:unnamed protein product [Boreogadus saida]
MNVLCVSGEQTQVSHRSSHCGGTTEGFSSLGPLSSVVMEVTEKARNLALLPRPDPRTGPHGVRLGTHPLQWAVEWVKHPGDITGDLTSADHTDGSCTELPEGSTIAWP